MVLLVPGAKRYNKNSTEEKRERPPSELHFTPLCGQAAKSQTAANKKEKNSLVLNLLQVFFCAVFLFAAYKLISQFLVYNEAVSEYDKVRQAAGVSEEEQTVSRPDFQALSAMNPEIVGWVTVPDTVISYPVVQAKDNKNTCTPLLKEKRTAPAVSLWIKTARRTPAGSTPFYMGTT
ncbi:MAG: hypothetical protein ACLUO4_07115 [Christensenellales bacterium]